MISIEALGLFYLIYGVHKIFGTSAHTQVQLGN